MDKKLEHYQPRLFVQKGPEQKNSRVFLVYHVSLGIGPVGACYFLTLLARQSKDFKTKTFDEETNKLNLEVIK